MKLTEGPLYLDAEGRVIGPLRKFTRRYRPDGIWGVGPQAPAPGKGWHENGRRASSYIDHPEDLIVELDAAYKPKLPKNLRDYDLVDHRLEVALDMRNSCAFERPTNMGQDKPRPLPWSYDKRHGHILDARGNTVATNTGNKDGPFIVRLANATQKGPTP